MLTFIAILLAVAALSYPYAAAAVSRFRMLRRLARVSRGLGFRFRHRGMPSVARNRGRRYDLLIENEEKIFAVKLWSAYRRDSALLVNEIGEIRERRRIREPLSVRRKKPQHHRSLALAVPRTRLTLRKTESRSVTRILLVYPSYREVLAERDCRTVRLGSGDNLFDKLLYSPSAFEALLRRESARGCDAKSEPKREAAEGVTA